MLPHGAARRPPATSIEAAVAIAEAGCTAIELGVPYSDPGMDGPVIQAATQSTLERGFRLEELFEVGVFVAAGHRVALEPVEHLGGTIKLILQQQLNGGHEPGAVVEQERPLEALLDRDAPLE